MLSCMLLQKLCLSPFQWLMTWSVFVTADLIGWCLFLSFCSRNIIFLPTFAFCNATLALNCFGFSQNIIPLDPSPLYINVTFLSRSNLYHYYLPWSITLIKIQNMLPTATQRTLINHLWCQFTNLLIKTELAKKSIGVIISPWSLVYASPTVNG